MRKQELSLEVIRRRSARESIRNAVNAYCEKKFGIRDFFAIADKHFMKQTDDFQICLSRQVPTPNIEHLALYLAAREWGIVPTFLSLIRDTFPQKGINEYKKSLISVPLVKKARNGGFAVNCQRVSGEKVLQGMIFSELRSFCGKRLPDFHWDMLEKAIPEGEIEKKDLSSFFSELFFEAKRCLPEFVFVRRGRYEKRFERSNCSITDDIRPPADWYYFFYLMIFLDGFRGLASTVDEDLKVVRWFEENNQKIKDICGFAPLILDTPLKVRMGEFHSKLNEIPQKALVGGSEFLGSLSRPISTDKSCFFEIMKHYEKELIARS
jgi:hypothetical protein